MITFTTTRSRLALVAAFMVVAGAALAWVGPPPPAVKAQASSLPPADIGCIRGYISGELPGGACLPMVTLVMPGGPECSVPWGSSPYRTRVTVRFCAPPAQKVRFTLINDSGTLVLHYPLTGYYLVSGTNPYEWTSPPCLPFWARRIIVESPDGTIQCVNAVNTCCSDLDSCIPQRVCDPPPQACAHCLNGDVYHLTTELTPSKRADNEQLHWRIQTNLPHSDVPTTYIAHYDEECLGASHATFTVSVHPDGTVTTANPDNLVKSGISSPDHIVVLVSTRLTHTVACEGRPDSLTGSGCAAAFRHELAISARAKSTTGGVVRNYEFASVSLQVDRNALELPDSLQAQPWSADCLPPFGGARSFLPAAMPVVSLRKDDFAHLPGGGPCEGDLTRCYPVKYYETVATISWGGPCAGFDVSEVTAWWKVPGGQEIASATFPSGSNRVGRAMAWAASHPTYEGYVAVPPGDFVEDSIRLDDPVRVAGSGRDRSVLHVGQRHGRADGTTALFYSDTPEEFHLTGIGLDANGLDAGLAATLHNSELGCIGVTGGSLAGLRLVGSSDTTVYDSEVVGSQGDGIRLESSLTNVTVQDTTVRDAERFGIIGAGGTAAVWIVRSHVDAAGQEGILISASQGAKVRDSTVANTTRNGIALEAASRDVDLTENTVTGAGGAGIEVRADSDAPSVYQNHIFGATGPGIHIADGIDGAEVAHNDVHGGSPGILAGNAPGVAIEQNEVSATIGDGIVVTNGPVGPRVSYNTVAGTGGHGINVGGHDLWVFDNTVTDAGGHGITLQPGSDQVVVRESTVDRSGDVGILAADMTGLDLGANHIHGSHGDGLRLQNLSAAGSLTGNTITNSGGNGALLDNIVDLHATFNDISDSALAGLVLRNQPYYTTLWDNTFSHNAREGLRIEGNTTDLDASHNEIRCNGTVVKLPAVRAEPPAQANSVQFNDIYHWQTQPPEEVVVGDRATNTLDPNDIQACP